MKYGMQAAGPYPLVDRVLVQSDGIQLSGRHHPVLFAGGPGNRHIARF
jgi:hypothetical protein